jgi:hypothetical protein
LDEGKMDNLFDCSIVTKEIINNLELALNDSFGIACSQTANCRKVNVSTGIQSEHCKSNSTKTQPVNIA